MTMFNGFDVCGVDFMDEEFFGPAPRFLRERRPTQTSYSEADQAPDQAWKHPVDALRNWVRRLIEA